MADAPICIDISHWQDFPDFQQVYASGVRGVIHKATEGTSYVDPNRAENCHNAVAAGLAISTYFWLKPGDAAAQAEFYLSVIDPVPGERVVIDFEEDGCTLTMLKDAVQALLDYNGDLKVTVYSGHLLKELLGNNSDQFLTDNTDLWLAQYTDDENDISWTEAVYPSWTLWQYSEQGEIAGIDGGYVDLNRFNGSDSEFLTWIGPADAVPPKPDPKPQPVRPVVAVTAPASVQVVVNGQIMRHRSRRHFKRGPDLHAR